MPSAEAEDVVFDGAEHTGVVEPGTIFTFNDMAWKSCI